MKLKTLFASLLLGLALATTACTGEQPDHGPPIVKQFDRGAKTITLRVIIYENYRQVTQAKIKFDGGTPSPELYGWSGWSKEEPGQCELHVVQAQYYRDPQFETWGHELAHCLYGSYHPEPVKPVPRLSK